ncbi:MULTISPECIES: TRAP transporter small permease [Enterobacteriaceae]|uniref:TRAP transporter small permease protein n=1 Tax=Raoultella lignicola TaxID=3040939 RepID=A0ABU9F3U9_9ENTR|nr:MULTISPECIES: TRAP transporter small permease [Enterobacteriaceae]MRT51555.1 TRAP transporter small permease subunit [Raoultella sp. RIT712]QNK06653.1 TRAP transporter small permease [Enterobacter sp. JUb54]ROS07008.1 TRAP-type C4-dicarboxylate transport system permease small subunit [Raoultella sp. BIGb0399]
MEKFRKGLDRLLELVCCLVLTIMVAVSCWQVISRYIVGRPSTITEELLRFMLVWISMLGMAYVAGKQQHISLTLLIDKVSTTVRHWWMIVLQLTFMAFSVWILIIGGLKISAISMLQVSPALGIPMGKVYYALPIAGMLIIIYSLLNIVDAVRTIRTSSPTVENHHD